MRKRNEGNFAVIREFVDRYFLENQRSPSTREIEAGTGIPRATAQRCLRLMSESGEISYGKRRGIETDLSRKIGDSVSVTLYESTVSCGTPNEPYADICEVISLPRSWVGEGEFFGVYAKGDSMVDIGVEEGDLLIARKQNTFDDGDLVIALVNGTETAFKRLYRGKENGGFILHAENKTYRGEELDRHAKNVSVQGIVLRVLKELK